MFSVGGVATGQAAFAAQDFQSGASAAYVSTEHGVGRWQSEPRKAASSQSEDKRKAEMWTRILGSEKDPHKIRRAEWERFTDDRRSGAIDSRGCSIPQEEGQTVRARTVNRPHAGDRAAGPGRLAAPPDHAEGPIAPDSLAH